MDENEDPSVTAAIVNVVCELGWRRPQDFLPLAPRLFELLVDSGNNWMAIKLIKLFATMTPLEPRLVKKLLPPLTSIIRTTPAMSLLYECINGIIQGGILGGSDAGEDAIAILCVNKLRGMIMVEGDPNLKYVALLAFNQIVLTHPFLVAQQEDVIMNCIDSPDMSIRLRALDLVVGMVSQDNLMSIVGRLMRQLRASSAHAELEADSSGGNSPYHSGDEDAEPRKKKADRSLILPDDYRVDVIRRISKMCSINNYANLVDFDWYINILTQLARSAPVVTVRQNEPSSRDSAPTDATESIGSELRNVAVKVKAIRPNATRAAETIIIDAYRGTTQPSLKARGALRPASWIVGEYASYLGSPEELLDALLHFIKSQTAGPPEILSMLLQAIPKVFAHLSGDENQSWTPERKTMLTLIMARIVYAIEPLGLHPVLEVQERAVEFTELMKLAAEAAAGQEASSSNDEDAPLLLTQAIPSLFAGLHLHSIAAGAQRNVPIPDELDLDAPINSRLGELLRDVGSVGDDTGDVDEIADYYHQKPSVSTVTLSAPAIERLGGGDSGVVESYQNSEDAYLDPDIVARRRAERAERNRDDPFYIAPKTDSGSNTPLDAVIRNENGTDFDVDSIPIMQLDLGRISPAVGSPRKPATPQSRMRIQVEADETLGGSGLSTPRSGEVDVRGKAKKKNAAGALFVDSSNIAQFSLEGPPEGEEAYDVGEDEDEMKKAMKEVEKLRLEMQRANERIHASDEVKQEVVRKKKKTVKSASDEMGQDGETTVVKKKKKRAKQPVGKMADDKVDNQTSGVADVVVKKKKKTTKKKKVEEEFKPEANAAAGSLL